MPLKLNQIVSIYIDCPDEIRKERYIKRNDNHDSWDTRKKRDDIDFLNLKTDYTVINDGSNDLNTVAQQIIDIIKKEME